MPGVPKQRWMKAGSASSSSGLDRAGASSTAPALFAVKEEIEDDEGPSVVPNVEGPDSNIQVIEDDEIRVVVRPKRPVFRFVPVQIITPYSRGRIASQHIHAWPDSRLCSIGPSDLRIKMNKTLGGFWHMELHMMGLCAWFCKNDLKIIKHAAELPPGVNQRIGARLSELPGHMTLAYDVPNGIAHQMQLWIRESVKEVCVRGGNFG